MGTQLSKPRVKANSKVKSVRNRLQRLRQNKTAPLFTTTSTVSLDKCDSLIDIPGYQFDSPSSVDLRRRADAQVDERPEDLIGWYKNLRNRIQAFDGCALGWRELKQALVEFVQNVEECDVHELRGTLLTKALRLDALLDEKRPGGNGGCADDGGEMVDSGEGEMDATLEEDLSDIDMRQVQTFDTFMVISARLDAVRYRMIEYYGDNMHPEFNAILEDLQEIMHDLRDIKDGGFIRVIVTREEYEDYVQTLQIRFLKLVEINMRQKKTSIFSGGTARSARIRRSNSNIAA